MALDAQRLLALAPITTRHAYTVRDTMLYALGVGASDLPFTYEQGLKALPSMAVVLAYPGFGWPDPTMKVDLTKVLHGETSVEIAGALPIEGEVVGHTSYDAVDDKGAAKGAAVFSTRRIVDADGRHLATVRNTGFLRGDGGGGGAGTPPVPAPPPPQRAPDEVATLTTSPDQALIYRLSGDYNPLHIDPAAAQAAGFPRPILHGLCTFGVVTRALVAALCEGDPARLRRFGCRFSSPVFPGETIETSLWRLDAGSFAYRARVVERDLVVLDNGFAGLA